MPGDAWARLFGAFSDSGADALPVSAEEVRREALRSLARGALPDLTMMYPLVWFALGLGVSFRWPRPGPPTEARPLGYCLVLGRRLNLRFHPRVQSGQGRGSGRARPSSRRPAGAFRRRWTRRSAAWRPGVRSSRPGRSHTSAHSQSPPRAAAASGSAPASSNRRPPRSSGSRRARRTGCCWWTTIGDGFEATSEIRRHEAGGPHALEGLAAELTFGVDEQGPSDDRLGWGGFAPGITAR